MEVSNKRGSYIRRFLRNLLSVLISKGRTCAEQANGILIKELSYKRGYYNRGFLSNHKDNFGRDEHYGVLIKGCSTKRGSHKRGQLYTKCIFTHKHTFPGNDNFYFWFLYMRGACKYCSY